MPQPLFTIFWSKPINSTPIIFKTYIVDYWIMHITLVFWNIISGMAKSYPRKVRLMKKDCEIFDMVENQHFPGKMKNCDKYINW